MIDYFTLRDCLLSLTPEQSTKISESDMFWTTYAGYEIYLSLNDNGHIVAVSLLSGSAAWGLTCRMANQENLKEDLLLTIKHFIASGELRKRHVEFIFKSLEKSSNIFLYLEEDIEIRLTKEEAKRLLSDVERKEAIDLFRVKTWGDKFVIVYRHSQLKRSGGCEETERNLAIK